MNRRNVKDLKIGILITVILWGILEIGLRWYVWKYRAPTLSQYKQRDRDIGWALDPGYHSPHININSMGFRGKDFSVKKPRGIFRIAMIGNSCVFGSGLNDTETIPVYLEKYLKKHEIPAEVINAGVPGYGMKHISIRFERDVIPLEPDMVILYGGWNDYFYYYPGDPQYRRKESSLFNKALEYSYVLKLFTKIAFQKIRPMLERNNNDDIELYKQYRPLQFIENYQAVLEKARSENIPIICLTLPSALGDKESDKYKSKFVYPFYTTNLYKLHILWDNYNGLIRKMGGSQTLDIAKRFQGLDKQSELFADMHHLNGSGTPIAASIIGGEIMKRFENFN